MSQEREFISAIVKNLPNVPADIQQGWIENPQALRRALTSSLLPQTGEISELGLNWGKAYELLGLNSEWYSLCREVNARHKSGYWVIPVINGATCSKVVEALKKAGCHVWKYVRVFEEVTDDERNPSCDGTYLVRVRSSVEAEKTAENASVEILKRDCRLGTTLLESMLLELAYFLTTGKHLGATVCIGSRDRHGHVPHIRYDTDQVQIGCLGYDRREAALRYRCVSLC